MPARCSYLSRPGGSVIYDHDRTRLTKQSKIGAVQSILPDNNIHTADTTFLWAVDCPLLLPQRAAARFAAASLHLSSLLFVSASGSNIHYGRSAPCEPLLGRIALGLKACAYLYGAVQLKMRRSS